jgi:GxxExxY protein
MPLHLEYKGLQLDCGYRLDFLVEQCVIVELKTVDTLQPIHEAQLLTYLKLADQLQRPSSQKRHQAHGSLAPYLI